MRIVIVEDEPLVAKDIERLILQESSENTVVAILPSVQAAKTWFSAHALPDIIFSDIRLSDGVSFEIYETMSLACPIVFTTAYDEYALRAFKLNSIDYILKPVDVKELNAALIKYRALQVRDLLTQQVNDFMQRWQSTANKKYKERFLVQQRNSLIPITTSSVGYFHKQEIIHLHTTNGEKFISDHQTLDEIESLVDPKDFFRVNRQYLVHLQMVERIRSTHKGLTVELKSSPTVEIDISREKASAFKEWLVK